MISHFFEEKSPGVFHAKSWNTQLDLESIEELFKIARLSNNKSRLCLHPNIYENMQVTYLAFLKPYKDKLHFHPSRSEILIPIIGDAEHRIFDKKGEIVSKSILSARLKSAISIESNTVHSLELISSKLLMLEIGSGPFTSESTIYIKKSSTDN